MRWFAIGLGVVLASSTPAWAQVRLDLSDTTVDFYDRGPIGPAQQGWVCNRWRVDHYGGGLNEISGIVVVYQDQNCSTTAQWQIGLFNEAIDPVTGVGTGTPDENNPVGLTALFSSPPCNGGTPNVPNAWIYTITGNGGAPLSTGVLANDVFTGQRFDSPANFPTDGSAGQVSVTGQGNSREYPSAGASGLYPPATAGQLPGGAYGCGFLAGSGGGPTATQYVAGVWEIWNQRLQLANGTALHVGANDSTNQLFASVPAVSPDNYGMAGQFPDARNRGGTTPPRADNPVFLAQHNTISGGVVSIVLSTALARRTILQPLDLGPIGILELDPTTELFTATLAGALPGLSQAVGGTSNTLLLDLTALRIRRLFNPPLELYAQALHIDVATGTIRLSNLGSWRYY